MTQAAELAKQIEAQLQNNVVTMESAFVIVVPASTSLMNALLVVELGEGLTSEAALQNLLERVRERSAKNVG